MKRLIEFPVLKAFSSVMFRPFAVAALTSVPICYIGSLFEPSMCKLLITTAVSTALSLVFIVFLGFDSTERKGIFNLISRNIRVLNNAEASK